MTARYPLWLDLFGRRVLIVGGGSVAARRLPGLIEAGAVVTVVAPEIAPSIRAAEVEVVSSSYDEELLDGAALVLACTNDAQVNATIAADCEARGVWCVRVDDAHASAAWVPASVDVDGLQIAVSGGGDPGLATAVRDAVEALLRAGDLPQRRRRRSAGIGRVVLVGGGPGDPDLLTLKGFRAVLDADVVIHDRLAPGGVLDLLPDDVEVIDVGKTPRSPSTSQDEINKLLVDRAENGDVVVRLKGGDPFVFGRGAEELAACRDAGIDVEIVPGLSSATAAPALAGVPLTERGTNQLFTVVSGHVPPGDPRSTVDWPALARSGGTLVLLMAVANLTAIAAALIDGGRDRQTPVVVVRDASMPTQVDDRATLGDLADSRIDASNPSVIVVLDRRLP